LSHGTSFRAYGSTVTDIAPACVGSTVSVAVTTDVPAASAVIKPASESTRATAAFVERQTTPDVGAPPQELTSAVTLSVSPTWMLADAGMTVTE
jgi:hypothetical protein